MAKKQLHHRRPAKRSHHLQADRNDSNDVNGLDVATTRGTVARAVSVIILSATVATIAYVVLSKRAGPDTPLITQLQDIRSFFFGEGPLPSGDIVTGADNSKSHHPESQPNLPEHRKTDMKLSTSSTSVPGKRTKDDVKAESRVPAQKNEKDFQETFLKKLVIHNISVNGRPVIAEELVGKKKRPEAASIRVYQFENFLSDGECDGLMNAHHKHVSLHSEDPIVCFDSVNTLRKHLHNARLYNIKVSSKDFTEGTTCVNSSFSRDLMSIIGWSYSTAFYPGETKFTSVFDSRVYQATGLEPSNGGKYQLTSYRMGIGYKSHTDCTIGNPDLRDRMGTILVYLQDVEEGGQTEFPELGISVTPRKGRAIAWNNQNSDGVCDPYSLHVAQPVIKGQKIILQRWYYYKSFYMLGKRSVEPELPLRSTLQPLVSCDEYDHGSCRWYDEWNYNHLNEYRLVRNELQ